MRHLRPSDSAASLLLACTLLALGTPASASPRDLTFEERVAAQEAIERVYYTHQIGATRPFEEAMSRELLEKKVRTYLKQSVVLEQVWSTPVTAEMLRAEVRRIARDTRFPERLEEIYLALNYDAFLVEECFARATLADRLIRSFFSFDSTLHASSRAEAEQLHDRLIGGQIDLGAPDPHRSVLTIRRSVEGAPSPSPAGSPSGDLRTIDLPSEAYDCSRATAPADVGGVGSVVERANTFAITALLAESADSAQIATYTVSKREWNDWWSEAQHGLDELAVAAVASSIDELPAPFGGHAVRAENVTAAAGTPCALDDTWDIGTLDDLPTGRYDHTAVWTGTQMIVWGGWTGPANSPYTNTGGRYDPVTDTWTPTSTVGAPTRRILHTAVWTGRQMIVWGGHDGSVTSSGGRYDPVTDTWTPTSTTGAPTSRSQHTAVWTGSQMIVWGGRGTINILSTIGGRYDPVADTWTSTSTAGAPTGRYLHTAVWTGSQMTVWGGYDFVTPINNGGRYDPVTDTWTPTATTGAPTGRYWHTAVWTGSEMIVWGGYDGTLTNTGRRYDPVTDTWTPTATAGAPTGREIHTAVWTGNQMIVWGGYDGDLTTTGGQYHPVTDTWTPTATAGAATGRTNYTAVWTGSKMIVWGGVHYANPPTNTGSRYDPVTDTWTPTSSAGAPTDRFYHTAVWTGSQMIVWGGYDGTNTNTGGRYDPVTDAWTPTATAGAPTGRSRHTAVWTGSQMIVWGDPALTTTGGRYDPVTDIWTPTATAGAPTGRSSHTAVWTGSQMIVWGGVDSPFTVANTGGRYDPVTDTWTPISTAGAPTRRYGHTAVWTGSQMIVWGGPFPDNDTGGRYDAVTDAWTPTSTAGAPTLRESHTAVWTGSQMIVWGGRGGTVTNTGGRYQPVTDTWTPTASAGAPTGRERHTAVWTGSQMIVWGGIRNDGSTFNTGGRYDPIADVWTPTSTAGAPTGRDSHTAVWTGSQMILWGGLPRGDGGRYLFSDDLDRDADGFAICAGDCDDLDSFVSPGASESCDGADNNCDGSIDEELGTTMCGIGACEATVANCVDGTPQVCAPGSPADEACNGVDDDCDGVTDEGFGPGVVAVALDPPEIWPPNHRMVDIHATVAVTEACPGACSTPPAVILSGLTSSEPDDADGAGDGHTTNDIQGATLGTQDFDVQLRAERDGKGDGRFYEASYTATDCFGDVAEGTAGTLVPHDEGGPSEPLLLTFLPDQGELGRYALRWNPIADAEGYNLVRGNGAGFHIIGSFVTFDGAECAAHGMTATSFSSSLVDEDPASGEVFFYLAEYAKGTYSGYGTETGGRDLIITSGDDCH